MKFIVEVPLDEEEGFDEKACRAFISKMLGVPPSYIEAAQHVQRTACKHCGNTNTYYDADHNECCLGCHRRR